MPGFFYNVGRLVGPKVRKGRWVWESATGAEADVIAAEERVGRDMHEAMAGQVGIDPDPEARALVDRIGGALAACVRNRHRRFRFTVAAGGEPNAFALPGGFIFITRSLVEFLDGGAEAIAFVLGHEIGHVVKQHPMGRVFNDAALSAAARALPAGGGMAGQWVKASALRLMQSAYSREQELLADKLGARLAAAAGFDPWGGPRMLQRLNELHATRPQLPLAEYFATHPPLGARVAELSRYIERKR